MICNKNIFCLLYPNTLCVNAEEMLKEITPGYYDDVITDGLKADRETGVSLLFYKSIEYTFKLKHCSMLKIDISN